LWLDESYLAVNILERGFGELHRPLEFSQSAPWLFLMASKIAVTVFGPSEMVMRLIPLLASVASLWVFWRLARECLEGWLVPVALGIFALAFRQVYYAQEVKQYSLEVLLTTLIVWQAALMFKSAKSQDRYFAGLAVTGSIGIFAMHAMPFVLAGTGLIALWAHWTGKLNVSFTRLAFAISVWLALFAVNYFVIIRPNYANDVMEIHWASAYPGMPWTLSGLRSWVGLISDYFGYLGFGGVFKVPVAVLLVAGLWRMILTRNLTLLACTVTVALYWLAAMAGKAPFSGRLVLFLFPFLPLFLGHGLALILRGRHWALCVLGAGIALGPTIKALPTIFRPFEEENLRDAVSQLSKLRKPSEPVYVIFWAWPAFKCYRQILDLSNLYDPVILLNQPKQKIVYPGEKGTRYSVVAEFPHMMQELSELHNHETFWVLVAHMPQREEELLRAIRDAFGLVPDMSYRTNASGLYHFTRGDLSPTKPE
jgi:hypothetical protein